MIVKIENKNGNILTLTQKESEYQIVSIMGINPPEAIINTTPIAGMDGTKFNSSYLNNRNIVITLQINGNAEKNRLYLYNMFRTKEKCTFYFQNESRNVKIDGYVETVECDLFENGQKAQISIICPYPYFKSLAESEEQISNEVSLFQFPFSINFNEPVPISEYISDNETIIYNDSDTETGALFDVNFRANVPSLKIGNSNGYIYLVYSFLSGDRLTIDTNRGQKKVYLERSGQTYNIFGSVQSGTTFFQIEPGENVMWYQCGGFENYVDIVLSFATAYRGV